jgi:hypothetical protein
MDQGTLVDVKPETTCYLLGGGLGVSNLFRSEEAMRGWLTEHPQFTGREAGALR